MKWAERNIGGWKTKDSTDAICTDKTEWCKRIFRESYFAPEREPSFLAARIITNIHRYPANSRILKTGVKKDKPRNLGRGERVQWLTSKKGFVNANCVQIKQIFFVADRGHACWESSRLQIIQQLFVSQQQKKEVIVTQRIGFLHVDLAHWHPYNIRRLPRG